MTGKRSAGPQRDFPPRTAKGGGDRKREREGREREGGGRDFPARTATAQAPKPPCFEFLQATSLAVPAGCKRVTVPMQQCHCVNLHPWLSWQRQRRSVPGRILGRDSSPTLGQDSRQDSGNRYLGRLDCDRGARGATACVPAAGRQPTRLAQVSLTALVRKLKPS